MRLAAFALSVALLLPAAPVRAEAAGERNAEQEKPGTPAEAVAIPESLLKRIDGAIKLLKEKEYEKFLGEYAHPVELKEMLTRKTLTELAADVEKKNVEPNLIKALEYVKAQKPRLDPKKKTASVDLAGCGLEDTQETITFQEVGGVWYICNHAEPPEARAGE